MAEGQDKSNKISITVKTPKEKVVVEVEEDSSIKDVSCSSILGILLTGLMTEISLLCSLYYRFMSNLHHI